MPNLGCGDPLATHRMSRGVFQKHNLSCFGHVYCICEQVHPKIIMILYFYFYMTSIVRNFKL
jgi:hypothetical protein